MNLEGLGVVAEARRHELEADEVLYIYLSISLSLYIYIYVYIYIHTYVYIYIYIYTYFVHVTWGLEYLDLLRDSLASELTSQ